jgi:hypothetical protein
MKIRGASRSSAGLALLAVIFASNWPTVGAAQVGAPPYDPALADQYQSAKLEDMLPATADARKVLARSRAFDATIYGTAAVLEYRQMYAQAVNRNDPQYVGFNAFSHGRALAGPGYKPFKTPNADTLYSNAWLDLRSGPVLFEVPDTAGRYFSANFLDIHGNASNISARTHGFKGGRFLIATTDWHGEVPEGTTLFRVTTPFAWILLRTLVQPSDRDLRAAQALQDRFVLRKVGGAAADGPFPDGHDESPAGFMRMLDFLLRTCGHPQSEEALVHGFRAIGIAGMGAVDSALADAAIKAGIEQGFADAQSVINASLTQTGGGTSGWSEPVDVGRYGLNYLYRAVINTRGAGANVVDENHPFTTFTDKAGERLDGSKSDYRLVLSPPPPARFFWSVTVYDATTRELVPNALHRYLISDRTSGLRRGKDGSVTIQFSQRLRDHQKSANLLPVPPRPFYVVIRAQGPEAAIADGKWRPAAVEKMPQAGTATE